MSTILMNNNVLAKLGLRIVWKWMIVRSESVCCAAFTWSLYVHFFETCNLGKRHADILKA